MTAVLLAGAAGCSSYGGYCTDKIDCQGGNDQDEEVCVIQQDLAEEVADIDGCVDDYDALFECLEDNESCTGDHQWTDAKRCDG
ncbi:MAG: hypothetical protein WKG00_41425, partial [Polyangiaceae bacterium]